MTVEMMTMPAREAKAKFHEYRAAVRARFTAEDALLMRVHQTLARGRPVLDLVVAMRTGGIDAYGRPKLAICRADATHVSFLQTRWNTNGQFWSGVERRNASPSRRVVLPDNTFPRLENGIVSCRARVPLVPPQFRPHGSLAAYHLLWEAEWVDVPKDPILLRHIGRYFYAVLAQWDLTPVERAVLRGR